MDHSLLQYGFVEEHDEPLLAAVDSATGFEHEDDSLYGEQHLAVPACFLRQVDMLDNLIPLLTEASLLGERDSGNAACISEYSVRLVVGCCGRDGCMRSCFFYFILCRYSLC